MSVPYNTAAIRQLMTSSFNVSELEGFCFDFFPTVAREFGPGMALSDRIQLLLLHCRQYERFPQLLEHLAEVRSQAYAQWEADITRPDADGRFVDDIDSHAPVYTVPQRNRWFVFSLAGVVVLLVGGFLWWTISPFSPRNRIEPMGEGFNVVVAGFVAEVEGGGTAVTDDSRALSQWLFNAIQKETGQLPAALQVDLRGPDEVAPVEGDDRDIRAANAANLAQIHNATILIYGVIIQTSNGTEVQPEFYVTDESFGYGSEVAGPDRLGQPIPIDQTLDPESRFDLNQQLNGRAMALRHIVAGLAYFYVGLYEDAAQEFDRAANTSGWETQEGKEVVYLLWGTAEMRTYDLITNPEPLNEALAVFRQAQAINPEYGRAYLGLGGAALAQAATLDEAGVAIGEVDADKLREAQHWYEESLVRSDQPASAYVPVKAAFGLGQVHLVGFEKEIEGFSGQTAWDYFTQVVETYEADGQPPDLAWFAARAHAYLGRLAGHLGDWAQMATEIRTAIEMLGQLDKTQRRTEARFWSWLALAEVKQENIDQAIKAYEQAIAIGEEPNVAGEDELNHWRQELELLQQGEE